jgi:zinc transporter 2
MKRLKCAVVLCSVFLVVETLGGFLSGSLAVLSDAAHLLSDLASFAVAVGANYLASLPSTPYHTFGLQRTESLAALFSMISLVIVCIGLAIEAFRRLYQIVLAGEDIEDIYEVNGKLMSQIATIGVMVNVALAFVLGEHHVHLPGYGGHDHSHGDCQHGSKQHSQTSQEKNHNHQEHNHGHEHKHSHGHHHPTETDALISPDTSFELHQDELLPENGVSEQKNVNLHAAYLHVLGDLAQSVAVMIAGLVIWLKPTWIIVDPIITFCFCMMVFSSTIGVFRSSISVLLEAVPPRLSWNKIYDDLNALDNVTDIHDLHIWCISDGVTSLSVHASTTDGDCSRALRAINQVCKKYNIEHVTAQVQPSIGECVTCTMTNQTCHGH